jgi:hypothetical protein
MPHAHRTVTLLLALIIAAPAVMLLTADDPLVAIGCYVLGLLLASLHHRPRPS